MKTRNMLIKRDKSSFVTNNQDTNYKRSIDIDTFHHSD